MADDTQNRMERLSIIPFLLSQAEDGDYTSVKELLHKTSALLDTGTPLPPISLTGLAEDSRISPREGTKNPPLD